MKSLKLTLFAVAISLLGASSCCCNADDTTVKNVIVMVGDGMGLAHISQANYLSNDTLFIDRVENIALTKTHSASHKVTDSAASGTAFAIGHKTNNGVLGMDADLQPQRSILEAAKESGMATGLVATYAITHATPAAFYAHNESRRDGEGIALDIMSENVDIFIGGGRDHFEKRDDKRNLTQELAKKGYATAYTINEVENHKNGRLAALLAENGLPTMLNGRGDMLPRATAAILNQLKTLSKNKGFFVMIEGSQIDGLSHDNNAQGTLEETLDFNRAVRIAFDFADENPGTLVLVFADHETGGLTLPSNGNDTQTRFSTGGHSAVMVPLYAYGAKACAFYGVMDNTEIPKRIAKVLDIEF